MTHIFNESILRAYDVRGVYNETLFDQDAYYLGRSFGSFLVKNNKEKIAVACDGRVSSPKLKEELVRGLLESGIDVTDVGVGPTPMLYFSVFHYNLDAGIMVTGSHNPKNHNGFKTALKERPFYGDDILNLAKTAESGDFVDGEGSFKEQNVQNDYVERLLSDSYIANSTSPLIDDLDEFEPERKLVIGWDAGNGAAGRVMQKLSERIASEDILLFSEIDGTFPNHHPDPTVEENLVDLRRVVLEEGCDLGIAFDGDGDRIGVIDDKGEVLWGDQLMIFYSRQILKEKPGSTIIADVKASDILFDEISKAGGKAIMHKTGHSLIKAKMKETNAALAGEMSGHIFFADKYYGFDDALYAAIRLINIVSKSDLPLSELRKTFPKAIATPEIRVECEDSKKFAIVDKLKESITKSGLKFNDIDGVRVSSDDGWWLIRASNTQPVLVARCESDSLEGLEKLKEELRKNLEFCQVKIPDELS